MLKTTRELKEPVINIAGRNLGKATVCIAVILGGEWVLFDHTNASCGQQIFQHGFTLAGFHCLS